jgi:hypothetical protein
MSEECNNNANAVPQEVELARGVGNGLAMPKQKLQVMPTTAIYLIMAAKRLMTIRSRMKFERSSLWRDVAMTIVRVKTVLCGNIEEANTESSSLSYHHDS